MTEAPEPGDGETILQFGGGRFLRSFADLFIHQSNPGRRNAGRVTIVQSTRSDRANQFRAQHGRYHVLVRGLSGGRVVDEAHEVASVRRVLVAAEEWPEVLRSSRNPDLRLVISNTTESGYQLDEDDSSARVPISFPAKLASVLRERFEARVGPVTIIPCELFERNADRLRALTLEQANRWGWSAPVHEWIAEGCSWRNNLVDRIVTGPPADHPLAQTDPLLSVAEPYALWAIEQPPELALIQHSAIQSVPDVTPYTLRKVRILNGAHTALVSKALPKGFTTVRESIEDPEIGSWLQRLLFEEIVPTLEGRVDSPVRFARQGLERFRNPFQEHRLHDIALYHDQKLKIRLLPTRDEFVERFGRRPPLLDELLASNL